MNDYFIQQDPSKQRLAQILAQSQQPQQQQGQMPKVPMSVAKNFMGGGGAGASTGTAGTTGTAGASGGSGFGSSMAAAGPWAALAAVILGNEHEARRGGYRSEDDKEYAQDLLGGKVFTQDINERWAPKFGPDKLGLGGDMQVAGELSSLDFSNAWKKLKNDSSLSKLLDIF